jgi:hypothetical protein
MRLSLIVAVAALTTLAFTAKAADLTFSANRSSRGTTSISGARTTGRSFWDTPPVSPIAPLTPCGFWRVCDRWRRPCDQRKASSSTRRLTSTLSSLRPIAGRLRQRSTKLPMCFASICGTCLRNGMDYQQSYSMMR